MINRYCIYQFMSTKVIHRWLRQPNFESHIRNRYANRHNPFENTLSVLDDPKNGRKLYLIGTTNASTTLAARTKKLLDDVKPDTVYVQTCNTWWNYAKHVEVNSQQTFTKISEEFPSDPYKWENNIRGLLWRVRYHLWKWTMQYFQYSPEDFKPFVPGLEMYHALKYAQKSGAKSIFGGGQYDAETLDALKISKGLSPFSLHYRKFKMLSLASTDTYALFDFFNTAQVRGGEAFAESMDRSRANFMVYLFSRLAPNQKKILVDLRDERIFRDLYATKAKTIVAVVNQWHVQGVQTHWKRSTGTETVVPQLSPVHDFSIDEYQESNLINDYLREFTCENTKSEPASWTNYLFCYHKQNYEYERVRHTHHLSHEDIPEPGQKHVAHH